MENLNSDLITEQDLDRYLETYDKQPICDYTISEHLFDFDNYGKSFTQVAIVLEPSSPLHVNGKKVYFVASEGGHDNGRELIYDNDKEEAIGPWLARRGITFIALCRIGRWNFFTQHSLGSWFDIPLEKRVPIYNRHQKSDWAENQYFTEAAKEISSSTGSLACRVAKQGSELEEFMLAATPATVVKGFQIALHALIREPRDKALLLYWGFSTGGPYMWGLSKSYTPDGIAGFGMTNFPLSRFASASAHGKFSWLYEASACRIRERGKPDFLFYAQGMTEEQIERRYQEALHSPRFKSTEDSFMFLNIAALTEMLTRLSRAEFLPVELKNGGLAKIFKENFDLVYPDQSLSSLKVLELFGTKDEIFLGTPDLMQAIQTTSGYCKKYKVTFLENLHHCTDAEQSRRFGSVWLEAIVNGYFN